MPTITVDEEELYEKFEKTLNENELNDLCFNFGLEIDETEIKNGKKFYKIEVPANRYDLISVEGIGIALKNYMGKFENRNYSIQNYNKEFCFKEQYVINVNKSVDENRAYIVGCILKNVKITERVYNNILELQEKLHHNIGKKRYILAIGIHDYDKIKFPINYKFEEKNNINFIPLNETTNLNGTNLIDFYKNNLHLKPYLKIIKDLDKYPVVVDANNKIISVPPIINCEHTKVTVDTKNLFFECTATDKNKAEICLNILCYILSEYCSPKFSIYPTLVVYSNEHAIEKGNSYLYPVFPKKSVICDLNYVKTISGIKDLTIEMIEQLLKKMMIKIKKNNDNSFVADIPFYRSDIMHCCDIVEDIIIAYGYFNVKMETYECPVTENLNSYADLFKNAAIECGYTEVITNTLLSLKENYTFMLRTHKPYSDENINISEYNPLAPPVTIKNSKSSEYEIVRTSLIANLLKFVAANKHKELPLRFFEAGDISYTCYNKTDTNAINKKYMGAIYADKNTAGLEEIHGVLEAILEEFNLYSDYKIEEKKKEGISVRCDVFYRLLPKEDLSFLKERVVDIVLFPHQLRFGIMGIIHPKVLENFGIDIPVSVFEINIESLHNNI